MKELTPAELGEKAAREDNQNAKDLREIKENSLQKSFVIKMLIDDMTIGSWVGEPNDLMDMYEDELVEVAGCVSDARKLAVTLCDLYSFMD